jgi:hypothetical protein
MSLEYPSRPSFFAHIFCRLLTKTATAQDLGPECCWLLAVIVHQEDAVRYQRAVTFWNDQLLPLCGFGSRKRLEATRSKAVAAGFLHYEAGGKSKPGRYWVTIPTGLQSLDDGAVCDASFLRDETGQENDRTKAPKRNGKGASFNPIPLTLIPKESTAKPTPPLDDLVELVNRFNEVAAQHGLPKSKLPPAKKLCSLWRAASNDETRLSALNNFDQIANAIADSEFVQGNASFSLPGLLSNNKLGESKLLKLLNGDYRNGKSDRRKITNRAGDVSRYSQSNWG